MTREEPSLRKTVSKLHHKGGVVLICLLIFNIYTRIVLKSNVYENTNSDVGWIPLSKISFLSKASVAPPLPITCISRFFPFAGDCERKNIHHDHLIPLCPEIQ